MLEEEQGSTLEWSEEVGLLRAEKRMHMEKELMGDRRACCALAFNLSKMGNLGRFGVGEQGDLVYILKELLLLLC